MFGKLLCAFGLHSWVLHKCVVEETGIGGWEVERRYEYCERCHKARNWLDIDE